MAAEILAARVAMLNVTSKEFKRLVAGTRLERRTWITWSVMTAIAVCCALGLYVITLPRWWSPLGVLPVAEAMILAWYLIHDCAHKLAFRSTRANMIMGEVLSVLVGTAVFSFDRYRRDHLRHHAEQVDLVGIHLAATLQALPSWFRSLLLGLESIYIPAVFAFVRLKSVAAELKGGEGRLRAALATLGYGAFYVTLGLLSPVGLLLWLLAAIIRIHCVRFVDAFQHTYDHVDSNERTRPRGYAYEQQNTFSFPVARRFWFLNLLLLNFGYHNAHHAAPNCPWYALPRVDEALRASLLAQGEAAKGLLPPDGIGFGALLKAYNHKRIERILAGNAGNAYGPDLEFSLCNFRGAFTDNLLG